MITSAQVFDHVFDISCSKKLSTNSEKDTGMNINKSRPVEELVGNNQGIVHMLVDRAHVAMSPVEVMREVKAAVSERWFDIPAPLRRGLVLEVIERHRQNRKTYQQVMSGRLI